MEKAVLRTKSIGTKVSDEEYARLEKLAEARGLTLSEWLRELALAELIAHPAEQIILTKRDEKGTKRGQPESLSE